MCSLSMLSSKISFWRSQGKEDDMQDGRHPRSNTGMQRHRRGFKAARHRAAERSTRHLGHHRPWRGSKFAGKWWLTVHRYRHGQGLDSGIPHIASASGQGMNTPPLTVWYLRHNYPILNKYLTQRSNKGFPADLFSGWLKRILHGLHNHAGAIDPSAPSLYFPEYRTSEYRFWIDRTLESASDSFVVIKSFCATCHLPWSQNCWI